MSEVKMPTSIDLPGNSINAKTPKEPERPKVSKVIEGKAIVRKKGFGDKFKNIFFGEVAGGIKDYIIQEVLIPTFKDTVGDLIIGTTEMILFGKRRRGYRTSGSNSAYIPYNTYCKSDSKPKTSRPTSTYYVEDILLDTRPQANDVLANMMDIIKDYDYVSVHEVYEMVGIDGVYTDHSWGWTDIGNASIRMVRTDDGPKYMLMLPRVECVK